MSDFEFDLRSELPRYQAPPELRAAILRAASPVREAPRGWWWVAAVSAGATAMAMALLLISVLPRVTPTDPLLRLTRSVVSEHTRNLIWGDLQLGQVRPYVVPAALPWITLETGIGHARAFLGDDQLRFVAGDPIYLDGRRGVALHYKDPDEHVVSYIALPAPGLTVPDAERVAVGRYRPALLRQDGFAIWVWKHADVACFLVADLVSETDLERFKSYFLRIRETTEPFIE
jgi:anti-sigma factor RsiW